MYKAQVSDGEMITCDDYDFDEKGVFLYDENREFLAFVPYHHLLYVGRADSEGRMVW